jgi:hypothetical protein
MIKFNFYLDYKTIISRVLKFNKLNLISKINKMKSFSCNKNSE